MRTLDGMFTILEPQPYLWRLPYDPTAPATGAVADAIDHYTQRIAKLADEGVSELMSLAGNTDPVDISAMTAVWLGIVDSLMNWWMEHPDESAAGDDAALHAAARPRCSETARPREPRGQTVVITGASSGIGAHAARQMAERGATVCLLARRADELEQVRDRIASAGGTRPRLPRRPRRRRGRRRGRQAAARRPPPHRRPGEQRRPLDPPADHRVARPRARLRAHDQDQLPRRPSG